MFLLRPVTPGTARKEFSRCCESNSPNICLAFRGFRLMLLSGQRALDSSGLGAAGLSVLANTVLLFSSLVQPHPTGTTWNDKEPSQAKVRCMVRASPRSRQALASLENSGGNPGVFGKFSFPREKERRRQCQGRSQNFRLACPAHRFL